MDRELPITALKKFGRSVERIRPANSSIPPCKAIVSGRRSSLSAKQKVARLLAAPAQNAKLSQI